MRLDSHRQWSEVNRAVRNLAVTVQALRKLAEWMRCDSAPPIDASSGRVNTPIKWRSRSFLRTRRHRQ